MITNTFQDPLIGKRVAGYEVQALIGRGAMGCVYLASDVSLGRKVALKVLLGNLVRNPAIVRRFHLEAQAAAPLRHMNIVRIYSAGIESGIPYIAMEYIEGEPLDQFLRRQGCVAWQTALFVGQQVAEALDCAHRHGVIHRDVKPANILLDRHGKALLTDFGIANVAVIDAPRNPMNESLGTPHYMSPEQITGEEVTAQSDLFSLGVTLFVMIAGRLPFQGNTPVALMRSITHDDPPRLNRLIPDVPDDVARHVAHLLSRKPEERPLGAQDVCRTIARLQEEKGGRSAMPEALRAFMREQTRIRPIWGNIKPQAFGGDGPARRKWLWRMIFMRTLAGVGLLMGCALMPVAISAWTRAHEIPPPREDVSLGSLTDLDPMFRIAKLDCSGYRCEDIGWIGRRHAVVARMGGLPGTRTHDATGLLVVDMDKRVVGNLQTPAGPTTEPFYWNIRAPWLGMPDATISERQERLALPIHGVQVAGIPMRVHIQARDWKTGMQYSGAMASAPIDAWCRTPGSPWGVKESGDVVFSPGGSRMCMTLADAQGGFYLLENKVTSEDFLQNGKRLTTPDVKVLPGSARYAPGGREIAYVRTKENGENELWVVSLSREESNGRPVAWGVLEDQFVFSPDGRQLAVRILLKDASDEIRLLSAASGMVATHIGSGTLARESWHPSGDYIIVSDQARLWSVDVAPPHERQALTPEEHRVVSGAAVSRDGRWAAAILETGNEPSILFVRLDAGDVEKPR